MFPIVADEDIDRAIVAKLRDRGVTVFSIDEEMKSATDPDVLATAKELGYPILTFDGAFARAYSQDHPFLHVTSHASDDAVVDAVCTILENVERERIDGLTHISPG